MKLDPDKIREIIKSNLVLIITIVVMLFLLLFVYVPKLSALSDSKAEFEDRAETLRANHDLISRLAPIGTEHVAAEMELQMLHRKHAGQHQIPEMLHSLTAATGDLDLELRGINRSPQEKTDFFVRVPLELNIEATFRSFAEYIDRITRIARLLDVRRIEITQDPEIYPRRLALHARVERAADALSLDREPDQLFADLKALRENEPEPDLNADVSQRLCVFGALWGRGEEALPVCAKALEANRDGLAPLLGRGLALTRQGDLDAALSDLQRVHTVLTESGEDMQDQPTGGTCRVDLLMQ